MPGRSRSPEERQGWQWRSELILASVLLAGSAPIWADDRRAKINYMLNCQGCHLPAAQGLGDQVPRMKDFAGYFTHSPEGRRFLIQVPGAATAPLDDEQLTELVNWILVTFSQDQLVENFQPYTVSEVRELRGQVEPDPGRQRQKILKALADTNNEIRQAWSR